MIADDVLLREFACGQEARKQLGGGGKTGAYKFYRHAAAAGMFSEGRLIFGCYDGRLGSFPGPGLPGMGIDTPLETRIGVLQACRVGLEITALTYHDDCAVADLARAEIFCGVLQSDLAEAGFEVIVGQASMAEGRPVGRHDEVGVVIDPTGRIDRHFLIGLQQFVLTWGILPVGCLCNALKKAYDIATGEEGFPGMFSGENPFWVDLLVPAGTSDSVRRTFPVLRKLVTSLPHARLTVIEL